MSKASFNRSSISKASGALMSSKLIPPNVGLILITVFTKSSTSVAFISMSMESISAKILKSIPFPSITGLLASGPRFPRPRIAVPFEITATKFPLPVYLYTSSMFAAIAFTGSATPGEYAMAKSRCVLYGFVGTISSFPFLPNSW